MEWSGMEWNVMEWSGMEWIGVEWSGMAEWFKDDRASSRYFALKDSFHNLRLYARGEQPIQKYKDELSVILFILFKH